MIAILRASTEFPSPLWGGVRGGGNPDDDRCAVPPSLSLPHEGGGDDSCSLALPNEAGCG